MAPNISLALTQHQINWWDHFNTELFEKVLEIKEKKEEAMERRTEVIKENTIFIFHSPFYKRIQVLNNNKQFIRLHNVFRKPANQ